MARSIDNAEDIIDSRDVIERIEELEGERDAHNEEHEAGDEPLQWAEACRDDAAELEALQALAEEASGYASDWHHGEQLIRDSYFETYAEELADDCGMIDRDAKWPTNCIDWERAARELRMDYTQVDFDGVVYWIR